MIGSMRPRGMGFFPLLVAALPAIASAVGAGQSAKAQAAAAGDAADAQREIARQQTLQARANAASRAKWMPWAIGGAVVVVGLGIWALSRRRSRR